jgi:NADPH2:quinone reductase
MKAGVVTENGLEVRDIAQPKPSPFELLVKVKAAGLNRADLAAALGIDWSGEVVKAGSETKGGFKPGDRVMCAGGDGYAEYAVCDWGRAVAIPDDMTFEHAATLPVALGTMHDALVTNGHLQAGQSVLIQGASSGVRLMACRSPSCSAPSA